MSQENVELGRQLIDALNRRDLDAFLELMDADVEAHSRLVVMEGGYHGHAGVRRWWDHLLGVFPDYAMEVVEARDLGGLTLAAVRVRAHGAGSGTPGEETVWNVTEWRDGKAVWWSNHGTKVEALEAAGLRE